MKNENSKKIKFLFKSERKIVEEIIKIFKDLAWKMMNNTKLCVTSQTQNRI